MKNYVVRAIIMLMLGCLPVSAEESPIVGEWLAATRSMGGLGGTKTYQADGSVIVTFGALLDMTWRVDENRLTISDRAGACVQRLTVSITNDTLTMVEETTSTTQTMKRLEGTAGSGIVGKWTGDHYTGAKQIIHFTTNFNYYFSVPMMNLKGTYAVDGARLTEEFEGKGKTDWNWKVTGGQLTLTKSGGSKTETYRKKE